MPKLKPEELQSRRKEIIDAARTCFLRSGFHQTTTDEICREASITPGGLYHYFASKEEIINAVIQERARRIVERLETITQGAGDLRSTGREMASFIMEAMRSPRVDNATGLDVEIWAESLRNEKLADMNREGWRLRRDWLEELIKRGVSEGLYSDRVDPRGLAHLFIALSSGVRVGRLMLGDEFETEKVLGALFLMYTGRLINRAPAASRPEVSRPEA